MEKNKFYILISLLTIALIVIGGIMLSQYNKDEDSGKKTADDSEIMSIAIKGDNYIYGITNGGKEIELMDIGQYNGGVVYTYKNDTLYLYVQSYVPGNYNVETGEVNKEFIENTELGYINLSDDELVYRKLIDIDIEGLPNSIAIANRDIYYTSASSNEIFKYNIPNRENETYDDLDFSDDDGIKLYTFSDDELIYSTSGTSDDSPTVGMINIDNNKKTVIYNNSSFEFVYNNKIILRNFLQKTNYLRYIEYDPSTRDFEEINGDLFTTTNSSNSQIIATNNSYIYSFESSLYRYSDGEVKLIYEFDDFIDSINLVSSDTLNIAYGMGMNNPSKFSHLDLDNFKLKDTSNTDYYSQIIYIK